MGVLESFPADIWQEAGIYPELVIYQKFIEASLRVSGPEETRVPRHIRHKLSADLSDDVMPVVMYSTLYIHRSSSVCEEMCAK